MRPVLIDLFCGGGAASVGYHASGWEVIGVDYVAQPGYPYEFHQLEVMDLLSNGGLATLLKWTGASAIHASPPCQSYSESTRHLSYGAPRLIEPLREVFRQNGLMGAVNNSSTGHGLDGLGGRNVAYVIENVPGAPMLWDKTIMLCGTMFGKRLRRHRYFESNVKLECPPFKCNHNRSGEIKGVSGGGALDARKRGESELWRQEMFGGYEKPGNRWTGELGWKGWEKIESTQAIPPCYTDYIGSQLLALRSY